MQHRCFFDDLTLLVDGKEAFPEILACIGRARRRIEINMFIWRDDAIGNAVARAILAAADRGVSVFLSVDRVGAVLEDAEEYRCSFFHKKLSQAERVKSFAVRLLYPSIYAEKRGTDAENKLYHAMLAHPHITAEIHTKKANHSKYYIFDDEILILGGINIEDKENGADISGRVYQDYMVKAVGADYVLGLRRALAGDPIVGPDYGFCVNSKVCTPHHFAIAGHYTDLIQNAREELLIAMAYFAPPKAFLEAIAQACQRGVRVTLLLPAHSNLMSSASLRAAAQLMRKTSNAPALYLTPKMMHTKLIANESELSFGSANMMKNAFASLSELNLFFRRTEHPFCKQLTDSVAQTIAGSRRILRAEELQYSRFLAALEGLFQ